MFVLRITVLLLAISIFGCGKGAPKTEMDANSNNAKEEAMKKAQDGAKAKGVMMEKFGNRGSK